MNPYVRVARTDQERLQIYSDYTRVQTAQVNVPPVASFPQTGANIAECVPYKNGQLEEVQTSTLSGYAPPHNVQGLNALVHDPIGGGPAFSWALFPAVRKVSSWGPNGPGANRLPDQMKAVQAQATGPITLPEVGSINFNENNVIVIPYAVVVSNGPMPSLLPRVLRQNANYQRLISKPDGNIYLETSFVSTASKDSMLAIISAARATITPQSWRGDVFITYAPFISEIVMEGLVHALSARYGLDAQSNVSIRNVFSFSGASCGLATAAAGLCAAPIMYTGYLSSMGSDTVLSDVEGALRHVIQGANMVEAVDEVAPKCCWALDKVWPICVPLNQSWRTVDIHNAIQYAAQAMTRQRKDAQGNMRNPLFSANPSYNERAVDGNTMVFPVAMSDYMFGMQDVTQQLKFEEVGALVLTAVTLAEAFILAAIAWEAVVHKKWYTTSARGQPMATKMAVVAAKTSRSVTTRQVAVQKAAKKGPKTGARSKGVKPGSKRSIKRTKATARKTAASKFDALTDTYLKFLNAPIAANLQTSKTRMQARQVDEEEEEEERKKGKGSKPGKERQQLRATQAVLQEQGRPTRAGAQAPGRAGRLPLPTNETIAELFERKFSQGGAPAAQSGVPLPQPGTVGGEDDDDGPNTAGIYALGADQKAAAFDALVGQEAAALARSGVPSISRLASKRMKALSRAARNSI